MLYCRPVSRGLLENRDQRDHKGCRVYKVSPAWMEWMVLTERQDYRVQMVHRERKGLKVSRDRKVLPVMTVLTERQGHKVSRDCKVSPAMMVPMEQTATMVHKGRLARKVRLESSVLKWGIPEVAPMRLRTSEEEQSTTVHMA